MLFWTSICFVLFIFATPSFWMLFQVKKDKRINIAWQIGKIVLSLFIGFVIGYLLLADHTISAFFSKLFWVYLIIALVDTGIYSLLKGKEKAYSFYGLYGFAFIIWLGFTITYPMMIAKDLYHLVNPQVNQSKMEAMSIQHIPTVPLESAQYKAEKLIGSIPNSSYYQLGELTRQKIKGEEYWVAPIEYRGYFQSKKARSTPGYIMVSAERADDTGTLKDNFHMKYVPSAYFGQNITRRVREKYTNLILFGEGFEPNDDGQPYYVIAVGHYAKYRSGSVVDGAVLVNPEKGEMKEYSLKDVPAFVDYVIPEKVATEYNHYQAQYKHGYWNTWFGKQDISEVTQWNTGEEVIGVFDANGRMSWFTDHSNPGSTSMVGYTLMDGRTGKFIYYTGAKGFADGSASLNAVHNTFKKEQWSGTNPVLYNIYGTETWYIPVIDSNGLLRKIAMVNAQNPQIVAYGDTKEEALDGYKLLLATDNNQSNTSPSSQADVKKITGKVLRVSTASMNGNMVVQVLLENSNKIFNIDPSQVVYASFIQEGDELDLTYSDTGETVVSVEKVYNQTLKR